MKIVFASIIVLLVVLLPDTQNSKSTLEQEKGKTPNCSVLEGLYYVHKLMSPDNVQKKEGISISQSSTQKGEWALILQKTGGKELCRAESRLLYNQVFQTKTNVIMCDVYTCAPFKKQPNSAPASPAPIPLFLAASLSPQYTR